MPPGCVESTRSCRAFDPAGPTTAADLAAHVGELDIDLPLTAAATVVSTTNGALTHPSATVRPANVSLNTAETTGGITFERRGGVALFRARSWKLRNVFIEGDLPAVFVATTTIEVLGHVAARCGQVGGATPEGQGGSGQADGTAGASGGGGGGHGTAGAKGADSVGDDDAFLAGGAAGALFDFDPARIRGGGSGGNGLVGGGGGGAVVLVAGTRVTIGDGVSTSWVGPGGSSPVNVLKGINVGGCGGGPGAGGGAGGLAVVEAPIVELTPNAGIAANGGGGGGTGSGGAAGRLDSATPYGGAAGAGDPCRVGAVGGNGAFGSTLPTAGSRNTPPCGEYEYSAGSGGGAGRIVIRTQSGSLGNAGAPAPTTVLSPTFGLSVSALPPDQP